MYEFLSYQVRDVMSRPVVVTPQASIAEVERVLEKSRFNALPVVDAKDRLVGLVTTLDLLKAFAFGEESILPPYEHIMRSPVAAVMSRNPATVTPRQPLTRLLEKMLVTRNKSFPVVDGDRLVGIVSRQDVMRALRRAAARERPADPPPRANRRAAASNPPA